MNRSKRYPWYEIGLYIFVITLFLVKFGWRILDPSFTGWLYEIGSDMLPDVATWEHFRYSKLSWPLGMIETYAWPQEVGVGNTNIIPWIAIPLQCVNGILPEQFQYFGWFLLLCYILQAYFGDRLLRLLHVDQPFLRFAGVALLVLSSAFLDRFHHLALNAHFFVLASLCVYFSPDKWQRKLFHLILLSFFSAWTHPYLILFPVAIGSAVFLQLWIRKNISFWMMLLLNLVNIGTVAFAFWSSGVFTLPFGASGASGFGNYSASLDTFFNNQGRSSWEWLHFPTYFIGQYEGLAYLGTGVLLLYLVLLMKKNFYRMLANVMKRNIPLWVVVFLLTVYAFGLQVTFGPSYRWGVTLYEHTFLFKMLTIFRSSGRYIWVLHQLLLILPVVYCSRSAWNSKKWLYPGLVIVLLIQVSDLYKSIRAPYYRDMYVHFEDLDQVAGIVAHAGGAIFAFPAYSRILEAYDDNHYLSASIARYRIPITTGHLPRQNITVQDSIIRITEQLIQEGKWIIGAEDVIVSGYQNGYNFGFLRKNDSTISIKDLGKYLLIFKKDNEAIAVQTAAYPDFDREIESVTTYLDRMAPHHIMLITTMDEAGYKLDEAFRQHFRNRKISRLQQKNAYIGIWKDGEAIYEQVSDRDIRMDTSLVLSSLAIDVDIASNIGAGNNDSWIKINNENFSLCKRGINIVVLDENGRIIDKKSFDTYRTMLNYK